jgi:hypothetical protein
VLASKSPSTGARRPDAERESHVVWIIR